MTQPLVCLISYTAGRMLSLSLSQIDSLEQTGRMSTGTHLFAEASFAFTAHCFSRCLFVPPGDTVWCPAVMRSIEISTVTVNYCSLLKQKERTAVNMFYNTSGAACRKMEQDGRCLCVYV